MKYHSTPPPRLLLRLLRSVEVYGIRGVMLHSYRRLFRSSKRHRLSGASEPALLKTPTAQQRAVPKQPHPFDLLHGVDTGGYLPSVADHAPVSLSAAYITGYNGIPPSTIRPAIAAVPIKHEDFSFVDIGCGKGRALLIAAEFPFRRLLGVEIAGTLCDVARANVALKPDWESRVSIFNQDATTFIYPEGPLLLFFYHPFFARILRRVLANLERQLRSSPRLTYLLYADSHSKRKSIDEIDIDDVRCRNVMNSFPMIREISDKEYSLSSEDAEADLLGNQVNRFTFFAADVTR